MNGNKFSHKQAESQVVKITGIKTYHFAAPPAPDMVLLLLPDKS